MRQRRQTTLWAALLLLVTVLVLGTAWLYTTWRSSQTVLPAGLSINGMAVGGMTRDQALAAVEQAYTVPISVTYAGEPIPAILPEIVELRVDMVATAENLDEVTTTQTSAEAFLQHLQRRFRRQEPEQIEVNAVVLYSRERVNAFLERTAQKYDHGPLQPVALPESGTFRPAAPGTELNSEASVPLLIDAILAADQADRQVDLVVETEPAPQAAAGILSDAITSALQDFGGVAGIFVKDLSSGQELCLNCDIAFHGLGALKIAIAVEVYRTEELPLDAEIASLMRGMLAASDNASADRLLTSVGATSALSGTQKVTELLRNMGLLSSFIAAPYGIEDRALPPDIATPANTRTDLTTNPDPFVQTTPMEAGLLLEAIYQCSRGGGSLRALYPQALTPAECEEMLGWLVRSETPSPLAGSMPVGTRIAHTHGWEDDTRADVALVYGHRNNFVLAVFLYQREGLVEEDSAPTLLRIGELAYRFFNG